MFSNKSFRVRTTWYIFLPEKSVRCYSKEKPPPPFSTKHESNNKERLFEFIC